MRLRAERSARLKLGCSYVSQATDLSTWSCCGSSEHWSRSVLILDITKPRRPNCQSDRVQVKIPIDKYDKSVQHPFIWQGLGLGMNWEIQLIRPLRTHRCGLPEVVRTLGDAIDLIDDDLPETLRFRPVWRHVKEMLITAAETKTGRAVETATTLLEHALKDEGWLN